MPRGTAKSKYTKKNQEKVGALEKQPNDECKQNKGQKVQTVKDAKEAKGRKNKGKVIKNQTEAVNEAGNDSLV